MKRTGNTKLLVSAIVILAVLASFAAAQQLSERQRLLQQGERATGLVVGIHKGVKGLRSVEARFITGGGDEVVGRDVHMTQWFNANEIGDPVNLHYETQEPEKILIARGLMMWSNPAFFLAGATVCFGLAFFIYRRSSVDTTD